MFNYKIRKIQSGGQSTMLPSQGVQGVPISKTSCTPEEWLTNIDKCQTGFSNTHFSGTDYDAVPSKLYDLLNYFNLGLIMDGDIETKIKKSLGIFFESLYGIFINYKNLKEINEFITKYLPKILSILTKKIKVDSDLFSNLLSKFTEYFKNSEENDLSKQYTQNLFKEFKLIELFKWLITDFLGDLSPLDLLNDFNKLIDDILIQQFNENYKIYNDVKIIKTTTETLKKNIDQSNETTETLKIKKDNNSSISIDKLNKPLYLLLEKKHSDKSTHINTGEPYLNIDKENNYTVLLDLAFIKICEKNNSSEQDKKKMNNEINKIISNIHSIINSLIKIFTNNLEAIIKYKDKSKLSNKDYPPIFNQFILFNNLHLKNINLFLSSLSNGDNIKLINNNKFIKGDIILVIRKVKERDQFDFFTIDEVSDYGDISFTLTTEEEKFYNDYSKNIISYKISDKIKDKIEAAVKMKVGPSDKVAELKKYLEEIKFEYYNSIIRKDVLKLKREYLKKLINGTENDIGLAKTKLEKSIQFINEASKSLIKGMMDKIQSQDVIQELYNMELNSGETQLVKTLDKINKSTKEIKNVIKVISKMPILQEHARYALIKQTFLLTFIASSQEEEEFKSIYLKNELKLQEEEAIREARREAEARRRNENQLWENIPYNEDEE